MHMCVDRLQLWRIAGLNWAEVSYVLSLESEERIRVSYAFKLQALAVRKVLGDWGEAKSSAELVFLNCGLHGAGDGSAVWSTRYSSRGP